MCAKKPSYKKNDSAIKRNSIYKNSCCGRRVANDLIFSLNMQQRRGLMHDFRCRRTPPTLHIGSVWNVAAVSLLFLHDPLFKKWVMFSGPLQQASCFHLFPAACPRVCMARADLAQSTSLFGIFWVELIPTSDSLCGSRRKGITHAFIGEVELQRMCQGPIMQN